MPSFTVRVELHHASTREDYEKLHTAMLEKGFVRVIKGNNGLWYSLPTAEYETESDLTPDQVRAVADEAAATTGRQRAVFVTQANGRAWSGLPRIQ